MQTIFPTTGRNVCASAERDYNGWLAGRLRDEGEVRRRRRRGFVTVGQSRLVGRA